MDQIWQENGETKSFKYIHCRNGNHGLIPYIRLFGDDGENLPIKRIIVGLSRNQEANLETITELVGDRKISNSVC